MGSLKRAATIAKRHAASGGAGSPRGPGAHPAMIVASVGERREQVPELVALGAQVLPVGLVGGDLDGYPLHEVKPVALQPHDLLGVIGEEAEILHPEIPQDLGADPVLAQVGGEAES